MLRTAAGCCAGGTVWVITLALLKVMCLGGHTEKPLCRGLCLCRTNQQIREKEVGQWKDLVSTYCSAVKDHWHGSKYPYISRSYTNSIEDT